MGCRIPSLFHLTQSSMELRHVAALAQVFGDHSTEIFLRNPQLEHRGSLALSFLDLHSVRIVYQLLCDELNELLHGVTPLKKSKGSSYKPLCPSLILTTSYRYAKIQEEFTLSLSQCSAPGDSPWIRGAPQSG